MNDTIFSIIKSLVDIQHEIEKQLYQKRERLKFRCQSNFNLHCLSFDDHLSLITDTFFLLSHNYSLSETLILILIMTLSKFVT